LRKTPNVDAVATIREHMEELRAVHNELRLMIKHDGANGYLRSSIVGSETGGSDIFPEYHPWWGCDSITDDAIAAGMLSIYFVDGQDPKETLKFPAFIECSRATADVAESVNRVRTKLKKYIVGLKEDDDFAPNMGMKKRDMAISEALNTSGNGRVCPKQLYRTIPVIANAVLSSARYYIDSSQSTAVTSVGAEKNRFAQLYDKSDDGRYLACFDILNQYPDDMPLARVRNRSNTLKVSLRFTSNAGRNPEKVAGVLPVLYCTDEPGALPPIRVSDLSKRDSEFKFEKIHPEPLISLTGLHEYLEGCQPKPRKKA